MSILDTHPNRDLIEEIEAVNAIFEENTIRDIVYAPAASGKTTDKIAEKKTPTLNLNISPEGGFGDASSDTHDPITTTLTLRIPNHPHLSFVVGFDDAYPEHPPIVVSTASTSARGEGRIAVDVLEGIIRQVHTPGQVCLFDALTEADQKFEELEIGDHNNNSNVNVLEGEADHSVTDPTTAGADNGDMHQDNDLTTPFSTMNLRESFSIDQPPDWVLSDVFTEKKSVFVGRAARVKSLKEAEGYIDYLLATDKKVAAATHNISAWRIRERKPGSSTSGHQQSIVQNSKDLAEYNIVQDCDDDGETAAGGRLLHLMQLMDVWDVVVVVTRWYGGIKLGPDRFRIINNVGRDALVKGGFDRSPGDGVTGSSEKGKKKGKK